jgi:hypothetical protein
MTAPYAASFAFASPSGPWLRFFAWWPRRMYDGRILWMRHGWRQLMTVHWHLTPGGGDSFWRYTDHTSEYKEGQSDD